MTTNTGEAMETVARELFDASGLAGLGHTWESVPEFTRTEFREKARRRLWERAQKPRCRCGDYAPVPCPIHRGSED